MDTRKEVIWSELSEIQLKKTYNYYYDKHKNITFIVKLRTSLFENIELIIENNYIGKAILNTKYRSLTFLNYLIIYEVKETQIYIALLWDTKRNPKILKILIDEMQ